MNRDSISLLKIVTSVILLLGVGAFALHHALRTQVFQGSAQSTKTAPSPTSVEAVRGDGGPAVSEEAPRTERAFLRAEEAGSDIIRPFSAQDPDELQAAEAEAAAITSTFTGVGLTRWRLVSVDVKHFVGDDFQAEASVADSVTLRPFPNMVLRIEKSRFKVQSVTGAALWEGKIQPPWDGLAEISIRDGKGYPTLSARIQLRDRSVAIFELDGVPGAYVAAEALPDHSWPHHPPGPSD